MNKSELISMIAKEAFMTKKDLINAIHEKTGLSKPKSKSTGEDNTQADNAVADVFFFAVSPDDPFIKVKVKIENPDEKGSRIVSALIPTEVLAAGIGLAKIVETFGIEK